MQPIYLDNQATTRCDPRVVVEMLPWFAEEFGNPHSSHHAKGIKAAQAIEEARQQVATLIGAEEREIHFTSGATESNNLAIKGAARFASLYRPESPRRIITLATEHKCVLESVQDLAAEGFEPVILPVQSDGLVEPAMLAHALKTPSLLVSIMMANNETGVLQDIPALAEMVHAAGASFHVDLAQAVGKIPVDVKGINVDFASISAHKFYGPKGVGALFVRRKPRARLVALFSGGGQERGLRAGTLPTPLIVGLGAACKLAQEEMPAEGERLKALRNRLLQQLQKGVPQLSINGSMDYRLPGNLNVCFPGVRALDLMAAAPLVQCSTGSACTSSTVSPSYVLRVMGLSADMAASAVRLSLGRFTTAEEVDRAASLLCRAYQVVYSAVKG
ncbi:cysteine desulfurase family protein [Entomobacter blattae]|uniref:Cysteine desulfurase n=1 Tax=Entomobacter blattae TaxID=2762277 RepID=A0A7H1NQS3_9PROT|nr:aminotransferase class V-fold PLP-dependent enzyme [Entomobacter blattae]QNT78133.1 Cysteine desulfurase IscS [Entomobacter blattae]